MSSATSRPAPAEPAPPSELVPALLERLKRPSEIPRRNRIYANRNLRMDRISLVGFDMDYTLALYDQEKMEELSALATVQKLVAVKGYPEAIRSLPYENALALRGLVIDRELGHVLKPDRYGSPGRAYHGRAPMSRAELQDMYHRERTRLASRRYAFIDTLFALPEAVLYIVLVDYFDKLSDGAKPTYNRLWEDIRECIDLAHRDGSIKSVIAADLPRYIERDEHLAEALHRFRSSGKRLFLLTNSALDYTDPVMTYLLDGQLSAYPSWRAYFDVVIVSACKPEFFTEERPFEELNADGTVVGRPAEGSFPRGRVYAGGNLKELETRIGARGDQVLFIGDHIYGDMLRSRKSSAWRTAMVIQELEHEVTVHDRVAGDLARLDDLDRQLRHFDAEIEEKQLLLRSLQRLEELHGPSPDLVGGRRLAKELVDKLRTELRATVAKHTTLEHELDVAFNPYWGPLFREGHEVSKFGDQVEDYACVYTSRVSNFRFYSPMRHFRGPRDRMPHER